jgi:cyclopropane fatty-acyl-phospholipid synthase-like methyltransferase
MNQSDYWQKYYTGKKDEEIPWSGVSLQLFELIHQETGLKSPFNALDIGCGKGDKSIYLAKLGNHVWGIDIAKSAIEEATIRSTDTENKPKFIVADISKLDTQDPLGETLFDLVLDLLTSQFLNREEKDSYLSGIKKHLISKKTWYVMHCFSKDSPEDKLENVEQWIRDIAQTKEDVEDVWGKYFEIKKRNHRQLPNGRKLDFYFMLAK